VKLEGTHELEVQDGALTKVKYSGDIQVGGTIASVGQRMLEGTAKMMAAQFFTCLGAENSKH
jgi:carbon monoxide dehydrogenase subunit G